METKEKIIKIARESLDDFGKQSTPFNKIFIMYSKGISPLYGWTHMAELDVCGRATHLQMWKRSFEEVETDISYNIGFARRYRALCKKHEISIDEEILDLWLIA